MKLSYLLVITLVLSLAMATAMIGQPPDEIPHSLIPPLKVKAERTASRAAPTVGIADAAAAQVTAPSNGATSTARTAPAVPVTPTPNGAASAYSKDQDAANDYANRLAIWNSPEMVDARLYVLEYSERSARSSRKEGEQFLARLSQLSPAEMTSWLARLQAKRAGIARQQEVTSAARQMMMEQSARRLEAARQAYDNINQWQSQSAQFAQERLRSGQLFSQQQTAMREIGRSAAVAGQRLYFDPLAPTLDPASPPARTRYAAAASLPGDLPRSDPRNFIRGEEGIDTGENGIATNGGPAPAAAPAAEVASAPTSGE